MSVVYHSKTFQFGHPYPANTFVLKIVSTAYISNALKNQLPLEQTLQTLIRKGAVWSDSILFVIIRATKLHKQIKEQTTIVVGSKGLVVLFWKIKW